MDASGIAIGGVLTQEGRPIAFTSRKLKIHERNYPTHDLELLAVIHALKLWRHYLLGQRFSLVTDHKSLKWIFTQPLLNMRQRRWVELLQEFDLEIIYRPGKENSVADALSRKAFVSLISMPSNPILEKIKEVAQLDPVYQQQLAAVKAREPQNEASLRHFDIDNGCLFYRYRICVPKDASLQKVILYEAHDSPTSGHPGYAKTLNAVRKSFFWNGMKKDIL